MSKPVFAGRRRREISVPAAVTAAAVAVVGSCVARANTVTATFVGATGSGWNTAGNWTPSGVPNNGTNGVSDYNVILGPSGIVTAMDLPGATIDTLTVNAGDQLTINPALTLNINGPTVTNNGVIQVDALTSNANLNFTANTTVSGTGSILLDDYNPYATLNSGAGATVNFSSGQTVHGVGVVNASAINNGTFNADYGGRSLVLQTGNMANNNLFEATGGGTLLINGITVNQSSAGLIKSDNTSSVSIMTSIINGGTINAASGGFINVNSSVFNAVKIGAGTTVVVQPASVLTITGGTLVDNGLIQVDTYSSNAQINFATNTTLSGTGAIFLDDNNPHPSVNTSAGAVLTQSAGHSITGSGDIDAALVNNGVVNANFPGQSLVAQISNMSNTSLFEATGGGTLAINGITLTQSGAGQILSDNLSSVSIYGGANIGGGSINASTGGTVTTSSATFTNVTIVSGTTVTVAAGTTLNIAGGSLVNNGLIRVDTLGSNADLNFTNPTSVTGTGTIALADYNPNARLTAAAGATVNLSSGQTVNGVGEIDAPLLNNGTVNASLAGHAIFLQTSAMTNNNLFEATGGGTLNVNGITVTQGAGGQIRADNISAVSIYNNANIIGGSINASTGGSVTTSSATFTSVGITTGTTVVIAASTTLNIAGGSLVNNGTILVDTFGGNADLNFTANTSVTGTGTITLQDYHPNAQITAAASANTVTFGAGQTVHGVGEIDPTVINNGTIDGDYVNQLLYLNGPITSTGTLAAANGGTLSVVGNAVLQGTGNTISAGTASFVNIASLTAAGTTISGLGTVTVTKAVFTGTTTNNGNLVIATAATATGSLNGSGTTTVNSGATFQLPRIHQGAFTVSGTATIPVVKPYVPANTVGSIGVLTINTGGTLDIGDSDLDITGTPLATVTAYVATGYNLPGGANWSGAGLTSAAAHAATSHLTALGVIQNNQGGSAIFTATKPFDGTTPGVGDVLVKYTFFGDANLDGKVDGSDYSLIDAGYQADKKTAGSATGWYNGDFNYDGTVDGSDYALIDNAFNNQGVGINSAAIVATATAQVAGPVAVPEPASIGLICAAGALLGIASSTGGTLRIGDPAARALRL